MRLLDLFCGAGGCSVGYHLARNHHPRLCPTCCDRGPQIRRSTDAACARYALEEMARGWRA